MTIFSILRFSLISPLGLRLLTSIDDGEEPTSLSSSPTIMVVVSRSQYLFRPWCHPDRMCSTSVFRLCRRHERTGRGRSRRVTDLGRPFLDPLVGRPQLGSRYVYYFTLFSLSRLSFFPVTNQVFYLSENVHRE